MIKIQWLGHACFKIILEDVQCVIDPYQDYYVPGYDVLDTSADFVYTSHPHKDHAAIENVKQFLRLVPSPNVTTVSGFHDEENGTLRGENIIHIFEHQSIRIAHFGDIGHLLSPQQIAQIGKIDIALVPVGGTYTINYRQAKELVQQIGATIVMPMHYKNEKLGFDILDPVDNFLRLCDNVVYGESNEYTVTFPLKPQTVVLKYAQQGDEI